MQTVIEAFTVHASNPMSIEDAIELISQVAPQADSDNGHFDAEQFLKIYFSSS
jgi:hypothetical protein